MRNIDWVLLGYQAALWIGCWFLVGRIEKLEDAERQVRNLRRRFEQIENALLKTARDRYIAQIHEDHGV